MRSSYSACAPLQTQITALLSVGMTNDINKHHYKEWDEFLPLSTSLRQQLKESLHPPDTEHSKENF